MEYSAENTAEELLRILAREKFIYITLFSIEQKKRQVILKHAAKDLQKLNEEEESLVKKIERLENSRQVLLHKNNYKETRLSLLLEGDFFTAEQKIKAKQLQAEIHKILQSIEKENQRNKSLLQESREMFQSMIHLLSHDEHSLYQKNGQEMRSQRGKPLFVDMNC